MNELPEVINLDQEVQKARETSEARVVHSHGYTLRGEIEHFLFCNNRFFGDGCIGHWTRTCDGCRKPKDNQPEKI